MSIPSPSSPQPSRFRLSRGAAWIIGAGFGVGLLLFFLLWLDQRNDSDFYRADGEQPLSAAGQVFEPLPAPTADGSLGRAASGMSDSTERAANAPRIVEPPRPASPPPPVATAPAPRPVSTAPPPPPAPRPSTAMAPGGVPVAISKPYPDYPAEALRRNESGKVIVRIDVGADGVPTDVSIARSSRSRSLDRAALQAARKWRFRPAQRDGRAVDSTVEVPIVFNLQQE